MMLTSGGAAPADVLTMSQACSWIAQNSLAVQSGLSKVRTPRISVGVARTQGFATRFASCSERARSASASATCWPNQTWVNKTAVATFDPERYEVLGLGRAVEQFQDLAVVPPELAERPLAQDPALRPLDPRDFERARDKEKNSATREPRRAAAA